MIEKIFLDDLNNLKSQIVILTDEIDKLKKDIAEVKGAIIFLREENRLRKIDVGFL